MDRGCCIIVRKVSVPYRGYSFFNYLLPYTPIYTAYIVSVPYRGYSFFNGKLQYVKTGRLFWVSVPYRGYSFFNISLWAVSISLKVFPSLTGVIRFLIVTAVQYGTLKSKYRFPSLTGVIRFLIFANPLLNRFVYMFPSLTGVIHFLINRCGTTVLLSDFRPLQGLFIF